MIAPADFEEKVRQTSFPKFAYLRILIKWLLKSISRTKFYLEVSYAQNYAIRCSANDTRGSGAIDKMNRILNILIS